MDRNAIIEKILETETAVSLYMALKYLSDTNLVSLAYDLGIDVASSMYDGEVK